MISRQTLIAVVLARGHANCLILSSGPMYPVRPLIFWIVTFVLIAVMVVLLRQVLLPFVAAMALAHLLDPLANRLERVGMNRAAATLLILGLFILGIITLLMVGIPIIGEEIAILIENLPAYSKRVQALVLDPSHPWLRKIVGTGLSEAQQSGGELTSMGAGWLADILHSLWSDGRALISIFSLLVVTPIVTAYLIYDWNRIVVALDNAVPSPQRNTVRALAREIDDKIAGYLRGQGVICLLLGAYYIIALRSIGLNHALLIGGVSGLIGFVPYLGSLTGLLLSVSVAIVQFGPTWTPVLVVVGIFFVGQSLADYVLAPHLIGSKVHLNPVWLIFALFAFGYLYGFVGLLIAVPAAASIGVLVRFALRQPAKFRPNGDIARLPSATSPRPQRR
jgi:predicted PurR-regulated permease PerM